MTDEKKVLIYSTPTCPYCVRAKNFMKENDIDYEDYNVADNTEKRNEMMNKSKQMGVPVLDINGEVIVGFDVQKVKQALNMS